ncbi:YfjI family protein [Serratia nevei]|uniref:YfjI family protein n=1 Tax=Serratia marcescens TaxID=615 RepID=UPI0023F808D6|nr:YfjI family protein [Serratia marcescens]MDF8324762.1 YfjI family protein [Serratia nevei]MDF8337780.1 YfjI family protein [Serratia nevei]MDF8348810.1 YfjI family protein [Serratia nevei]MDP8638180.1 YfjI family protein [Serratia marcescens]MDP8831748.1 YfjI family protein [Serratia marcescens]
MNLPLELYNASLANQPGGQYHPVKDTPLPYPVQSFPPVLLNVIQALHNNTQIPVELIGNVVLAATSLTCQSLIEVIQPHTNMPEPCSLYLMTIAESGEGKTTINKQVMKPCYTFSAELIQQYEQQLINYKQKLKLWKIRQQALESNLRQAIKKGYSGENEEHEISKHVQNEPVRPRRPNFIYEDTSLKALVEGLSEHPEAGFISDEAITFFKSYLKNNPGLLNKAWDGKVFDFRRADGEIYQIVPCLTFSLMSQPGVFMDYIEKHGVSARASGFLSRFLFAWTKSTIGERQNTHTPLEPEYDLNVFYQRVIELLAQNKISLFTGTTQKKKLTLTDEALTIWKENRTQIERKIAPDCEWEHIRDIASKASANTLRIAALIQFFYDESSEIISPDAIKCAISLMEWHLNQACMIFYPMSERFQFEQDVRELHAWIMNRIRQNNNCAILKNDLEKFGPHRLRRTEKLTPVLNQLISQGYFGVIQMHAHSALYITLHHQNGMFIPPYGFTYNSPVIIIQSRNNTKGRPYYVAIHPNSL